MSTGDTLQKWYAANRDRISAQRRAKYDPEKQREYTLANRDKIREQSKVRRLADPEKFRIRSRAYYNAHREERREYNRHWRAAHPNYAQEHLEANRPRYAQYHRDRVYQLDATTYAALRERQGALCALCRSDAPLTVDHNHRTGLVRGLLCRDCNLALGFFHDRPAVLQAAIAYLQGEGRDAP